MNLVIGRRQQAKSECIEGNRRQYFAFYIHSTESRKRIHRSCEYICSHYQIFQCNDMLKYIFTLQTLPEYIAAHIQSGLVVDIIQPQHDQPGTISSHNIYNNSEAIDQNASPLEMTTERHYIASEENVPMPMEHIQQSLHSGHSAMQSTEHLSHRNHYESTSTIESDRKVIMGEPGRQYILTNEAPVIVSNKVNLSHSTIFDIH